ncbi:hypothetical protein W97_06503 [Coniosporium apollinis CBS 100218]|uniref:Delta(24)-sterol reductase n=1 Tax=Coniosporium apollinis (strain CBS 100218) TaxID=1168221 RepID=R7YZ66_CONA1|nr:uncharacterized protein W97_06503 [Coniosporium apollinis CBS 100218]EON67250.1 hypothetical protein W97_06503 [Coniosporium apollinis CBS 100218]
MEQHKERVAAIAARVRHFHDRKEPFRMYHGSTNSTRQLTRRRDNTIDTSGLTHVLEVSRSTMSALVEPNVPMDALCEATLKHNLVAPIIMEFPGITVGGGFSGSSGESSSFKYGLFDCTVRSIEIVLGNGDIVTASETENQDLFRGAAGSCGTLGVVTLLELQLVGAAEYVELTYHPFVSMPQAIKDIEAATHNRSIDYVDGIVFAPDRACIMTGRRVSSPPSGARIQRFTRPYDPWFYIHCERLLKNKTTPIAEAIPLVDYLFRYDRGTFWGGMHAFHYFMAPFNRVTRFLLDHFMHTRVMYHAFHASGLAAQTIVQDLALPFATAEAFIKHIDATLGFYPLWLCPVRAKPRGQSFAVGRNLPDAGMMLNIGVWGMGPANHEEFVKKNRELERKVRELRGIKCLYAHTYYTEDEFWEIYDRKWYEELRVRYQATLLPSVYEKVRVPVREKTREDVNVGLGAWLLLLFWSTWPFSGLYGVWKAIAGGDYLLAKEKEE